MTYILFVLVGACSFGLLSTFVKKAYESGFNVSEVVGSQNLFGVIMLWILVFVTAKFTKQPAARQVFRVRSSSCLSEL
jgi:drug/metabolite transporter (DMT)-like permease